MKLKYVMLLVMLIASVADYYLLPILFKHGSSSAFDLGLAFSVFTFFGWIYAISLLQEKKRNER